MGGSDDNGFNTQPPEGGWLFFSLAAGQRLGFQHTAARRRLDPMEIITGLEYRFNTQPPEGGWTLQNSVILLFQRFNTQPPEGGWKRFKTA